MIGHWGASLALKETWWERKKMLHFKTMFLGQLFFVRLFRCLSCLFKRLFTYSPYICLSNLLRLQLQCVSHSIDMSCKKKHLALQLELKEAVSQTIFLLVAYKNVKSYGTGAEDAQAEQDKSNKSKTRQTMGMKAVVWDRKKEDGERFVEFLCLLSLQKMLHSTFRGGWRHKK